MSRNQRFRPPNQERRRLLHHCACSLRGLSALKAPEVTPPGRSVHRHRNCGRAAKARTLSRGDHRKYQPSRRLHKPPYMDKIPTVALRSQIPEEYGAHLNINLFSDLRLNLLSEHKPHTTASRPAPLQNKSRVTVGTTPLKQNRHPNAKTRRRRYCDSGGKVSHDQPDDVHTHFTDVWTSAHAPPAHPERPADGGRKRTALRPEERLCAGRGSAGFQGQTNCGALGRRVGRAELGRAAGRLTLSGTGGQVARHDRGVQDEAPHNLATGGRGARPGQRVPRAGPGSPAPEEARHRTAAWEQARGAPSTN